MNPNKEGKSRFLTNLELKHPENLSKDFLLMLLKERYIGNKSLDDLDKLDLIDLYHEIIQPYPQREYQKNKRGKLLIKAREENNEQCNKEGDPMQSSGTTISILNPSKRKLNDHAKGRKEDNKVISLMSPSNKHNDKLCSDHSPNGTGKSDRLLSVKNQPSKRTASIESEGSDSDTKKHKPIKWP